MDKKKVDLFGDDQDDGKPLNEFEALLNSSNVSARGLAPGDRFRGEVLVVSGQEAFISTGTPTDAVMPFNPAAPPKVGDFIDVMVVRAREGEILVRSADARGVTAEADNIEDAYDMELPVEGTVLEAVKGGFRVKVQGTAIKAFCPVSQIDWRCSQPEDYVNKKYEFIITKYERGRDLVVSRRKLLEQERAAGEGDFLQTAQIGEIYTVKIFRLRSTGRSFGSRTALRV